MSRHHILPPIVYTPVPKPKKAESRPKTGRLQKKGAAASGEVGDLEETGEVGAFAAARAATHPLPDTSTSIGAAEQRIPSTTGKLSESTLRELLLAQEQESAAGAGTDVNARIKSGHDD
ncbi:hypothetical protein SAMN05444159_2949 [Bradyrhizobium lablabi]|uniref:Uncharacterized protein n=1 Tax=Bradyrhizobium lablabi TaxID=722472 RepID=A0A1M6RDL6_9BRAD|nr:hypothetical protein [Bradyrhizobium lablabi]SHK30585.1 hypothetical protein SAMN05444159_2949 [Bradyrhizobium lablabi]